MSVNVSARSTDCYDNVTSQNTLTETEIKNLLGHFRADKSRLIRNKGLDQHQAIIMAAKIFPPYFPSHRLPKAVAELKKYEPTAKEVQDFIAKAQENGELTVVQTNNPPEDSHTKQSEAEAKQKLLQSKMEEALTKLTHSHSKAESLIAKLSVMESCFTPASTKQKAIKERSCEAKGDQPYKLKDFMLDAATVGLYLLLIPGTASVFSTVLKHLETPFPIVITSYVLAIIVDMIAVFYVRHACRVLPEKKGYRSLAIAVGLVGLNAAGLYYKMTHEATAAEKPVILAQELKTEKARLHWLSSKWRNETDPVQCEANPVSCETHPFTQSARSRQNSYELEKSKLKLLTNKNLIDTNSLVHAGYFLLFWALLGLVAHLKHGIAT